MNVTQNIQLNQWESADRIMMEDFNADNAKTDAALGELSAALALKGNCRIETFTYTGTGTYGDSGNSTKITFPSVPKAFFTAGHGGFLVGRGGESRAIAVVTNLNSTGAGLSTLTLTWNGTTCSFYHASSAGLQLNTANTEYFVIALYAEDQ